MSAIHDMIASCPLTSDVSSAMAECAEACRRCERACDELLTQVAA